MPHMPPMDKNVADQVILPVRPLLLQVLYVVVWWSATVLTIMLLLMPVLNSFADSWNLDTKSGVIKSADLDTQISVEGAVFNPKVVYTYNVNGREYESSSVFTNPRSLNHIDAMKIVAQFTNGMTVPVHYDPENPKKSALILSAPPIYYILSLLVPPMLGVGIFLIMPLIKLPWQVVRLRKFLASTPTTEWHIPGWGVLRQAEGVAVIGSSSRIMRAIFISLSVPCVLACILSLFVRAIYPQLSGRIEEMVFAVTTIIAVDLAVVIGLLWRKKDRLRVEINTVLRSIRLSAGERRVELPFDQVQCWKIRYVANRRLPFFQMMIREVPLLALVTRKGREVPIHVFYYQVGPVELARKAAWAVANLTGMQFVRLEKPRLEFGDLDEGPRTATFPTVEQQLSKRIDAEKS
ncbi:MAG: DUF3592 domain-containing protein [Planctomycetes bacterium]|nr:DUF3592 domain-containing protein [Planctomycetota bacterium]